MSPFQKQDWLIRKAGGFPNPGKTGDGELKIHLGLDKGGNDKRGKVIFSVKTGKQRKPEMQRELKGTMRENDGVTGVLILDQDPSDTMDIRASKTGKIQCSYDKKLPPSEFNKIQIITSGEIISGHKIAVPPSMQKIREHRGENRQTSF